MTKIDPLYLLAVVAKETATTAELKEQIGLLHRRVVEDMATLRTEIERLRKDSKDQPDD